jgi:hypothetical protein
MISDSNEENKASTNHWWNDAWLSEHAYYWFTRYDALIDAGYQWQDVYQEACLRLILADKNVAVKNEWGYLRNLCRNICAEWHRNIKRFDKIDAVLEDQDGKSKLLSVIDHYVQKLGCRCKILLTMRYLLIPTIRDRHEIVSAIKTTCGQELQPDALHMHNRPCIDALIKLIENDEDGLLS